MKRYISFSFFFSARSFDKLFSVEDANFHGAAGESTAAGITMPSGSPMSSYGYDGCASERADSNDLQELMMYRQAVPLVHSRSMAAAKTLKTMVPRSSDISKRMLARQHDQNTNHSSVMVQPGGNGNGKWAQRQLEFMAACEAMMRQFCAWDGSHPEPLRVKQSRVSELLQAFNLHVDPASYRQWEQTLSEQSDMVSVRVFVQACRLWFGERFFVKHLKAQFAKLSSSSKHNFEQLANHPFSRMVRENESVAAFDYREYANRAVVISKETPSLSSVCHSSLYSLAGDL